MSDSPNAEVLDFLREQFARVHARLDRIEVMAGGDQPGWGGDMRSLQADVRSLREEMASRLDQTERSVEERLARIEVLLDGAAAMSDNPNTEVLDFLREDVRNLRVRMTSMEAEIAYVRLSLAELNGRFDRLEPRVYRIERRLDLVDGPTA